ncbi:pro-melanin-concentrating hormone, like [Gadus chalcogrammus]|uniref:pro-melanin-concentrating hormone, like n=1 Tax=Gadus chalcogrammus TaxID=1042646 RepID=UPI0024C3A38F|nr:pro-melanin-concentrating hormone, like [Gadus chalcogrammus]
MRQSAVMPSLFAAALLFQCYAAAAAGPLSRNVDDGDASLEQDTLSSLLLGEEAAEQSLAGGDDTAVTVGRSGGPRVIVMMADAAVLRNLRALDRGLSYYKQQQQQTKAGDGGLTLERRERLVGLEPGMALRKRDTMRCMVGRVYRPCWEA